MKKGNTLLAIFFVSLLASCGNAELESRITKLEGRVAALEGRNGAAPIRQTSPVPSANTATPAKAAEPEKKPEGPLPTFAFEEEMHDFGEIKDGDVVEHVFKFTNDGEAPLIITDAKATCGCTVPEWPREPIPVGSQGEIKVRFNSKNKSGNQTKTVTLTANTWPSTKRIKIRASVLKDGE